MKRTDHNETILSERQRHLQRLSSGPRIAPSMDGRERRALCISRALGHAAYLHRFAWRPPVSRRCRGRESHRAQPLAGAAIRASASRHRHGPSRPFLSRQRLQHTELGRRPADGAATRPCTAVHARPPVSF